MQLEIIWSEKDKFLPRKEEMQKEIDKIENKNKEIQEYNKHVSKKNNFLMEMMYGFSYMWPMIASLVSIGLLFFLLPKFLNIGIISNITEEVRAAGDIEKLVGTYIIGFFIYFLLDILISIIIGYILIRIYKKLHNKHLDCWEYEQYPKFSKEDTRKYDFYIFCEAIENKKEVKKILVTKDEIFFDDINFINYDFKVEIKEGKKVTINFDKKTIII